MTRLRYSDGTDFIWIEVPWGNHTGNIPPPVIEFYNRTGGSRLFTYVGVE